MSLGKVSYYRTEAGNWIAYVHERDITFMWNCYKGYPKKWVMVGNFCSRVNPKKNPPSYITPLTCDDMEVYCNETR